MLDVYRVVFLQVGHFLGAIRGRSELRIDREGVDVNGGVSSQSREAKGTPKLQDASECRQPTLRV